MRDYHPTEIRQIKSSLQDCGKEFYIDNLNDIKNYFDGECTENSCFELIKSKTRWNDKTDTSLHMRISKVKMFFEKDQIPIALFLTYKSTKISNQLKDNAKNILLSLIDQEDVDNLENMQLDLENLTGDHMTKPLNQIFYGPPGTGKTYSVKAEAESILKSDDNSGELTRNEKFGRICESLRNHFDYEAKSNSLYRNERAIMWMFGWIINYDEFDSNNTINKDDAIERGFRPGPSSWSQRSKYIRHFGFVENWKLKTEIVLNQKGIDLKNEIKQYMDEHDIDDIREFANNPPTFVCDKYYESIKEQVLDECTPTMKTVFCTLNMLLNDVEFPSSEISWVNASSELRNNVIGYFDLSRPDGDLKWVGHFGRALNGLGIVDKSATNLYTLSSEGNQLIDSIIANWEAEFPGIFIPEITYETALLLRRVEFITFHQSYSYEEFIEGLKPVPVDDNQIGYEVTSGLFRRICKRAKNDLENNYILIIDEINRGNISKIFGELITFIEDTKRLGSNEHPQEATLPYSLEKFGVPRNLYLIGTMNTADKSITSIDSALRRRFSFKEFPPKAEIISHFEDTRSPTDDGIDLKALLTIINQRVEFLLDKDHLIGHAFLKNVNNSEDLCRCFVDKIIPQLDEYFYGDMEKLQRVFGDNNSLISKEDDEKIIIDRKIGSEKLFGDDFGDYDDRKLYAVSEKLKNRTFESDAFIKIYERSISTSDV